MSNKIERLIPNSTPHYVRIYDNGGESTDRYTIVFTGRYAGRQGCDYISMSSTPHHPTYGFCQHGWHTQVIDRPGYSHLGKAIAFTDLPEDCQQVVLCDYKKIWQLN